MKIKAIISHFKKVDPIIYNALKDMEFELLIRTRKEAEYFEELCRTIIAQQLAGKAAKAIVARFYELFDGKKATPDRVLDISEQKLRDVGMSWAKAKYTRDLAQKVKDKQVMLENLHKLSEEEVIEELTKVKGIGSWTAEMFLIFTLGKEDIFSHGDLGLRNGIRVLYGFKDKPSEKEIDKIVSKWSPYKSYASLALWRSVDIKK